MTSQKTTELHDGLNALARQAFELWQLASDLDISPVREMLTTLEMQAADIQLVLSALTEK